LILAKNELNKITLYPSPLVREDSAEQKLTKCQVLREVFSTRYARKMGEG